MVTHEIIGDDMQAVILTLGPGDQVRAEAGAMMFMTDSIEMDAKMAAGYFTEGAVPDGNELSKAKGRGLDA